MDWGQIQINWEQVCARIRVTWGKLSEDDLAAIAGDREALSSLLQERYRYRKAQADKRIEQFAEGLVLNRPAPKLGSTRPGAFEQRGSLTVSSQWRSDAVSFHIISGLQPRRSDGMTRCSPMFFSQSGRYQYG